MAFSSLLLWCRCRLVLVCESLSKVIPPLRSRCLPIRVPAPEVEDIKGVLQHIAKKEDIVLNDGQPHLPSPSRGVQWRGQRLFPSLPASRSHWFGSVVSPSALALQLAEDSGRNLRKAILMLEACSVKQSLPSSLNQPPSARSRIAFRSLTPRSLRLSPCSPEMRQDDKGIQPRRADWENFIDYIGRLVVAEQSPERSTQRRAHLPLQPRLSSAPKPS